MRALDAPVLVTIDPPLTGHEHMARDLLLLKDAEEGKAACRVYSWNGPWVSLGRFQAPERDLLDPKLVPWVMRPTGGKAVLHGHDVTVGFALPLRQVGAARDVRTAYETAVGPLILALGRCGVSAALAKDTPFARSSGISADCFATNAPNDILSPIDGRKLCGCALRFTRKALLLQASIPVGAPLIDPRLLFDHPAPPMRPLPIDVHQFAEALMDALAQLVEPQS